MPKVARSQSAESITGVQAMQGLGVKPPKGFWADAWDQVIRRPSAIIGLTWVAIIAFFAVFAPLLANGHPLITVPLAEDGTKLVWLVDDRGTPYHPLDLSAPRFDAETNTLTRQDGTTTTLQERPWISPLVRNLSVVDVLCVVGFFAAAFILIVPGLGSRGQRLGIVIAGSVQAAVTVIVVSIALSQFGASRSDPALRPLLTEFPWLVPATITIGATLVAAAFAFIPTVRNPIGRIAIVSITAGIAALAIAEFRDAPITRFDYQNQVLRGRIAATYTLVPWSQSQAPTDRDAKNLPPGSMSDQPLARSAVARLPLVQPATPAQLERAMNEVTRLPLPETEKDEIRSIFRGFLVEDQPVTREQARRIISDALANSGLPHHLGTDGQGRDVLSQLMHACRLAISIGLVSTGIAVVIGVTVGALMGYFGGIVDLVLYRIVEIFMAIPVLFLLILAAGVLPRNTYVMMAIIGCVTWTGAARYIRAEFYRLRNQDFVQSARAVGLPLRSILFRHMLPNGVTPVLVDSSFAIAAAILFEAVISYLGLGDLSQASWGRLLRDATGEAGAFQWWVAVYPGLAIFLTVLAYNLIGEALRDAIDPKLKKARV